MKKNKRNRLLKGLKNLKSKYYCEFSEKEHFILDRAIKAIKRKTEPKRNWTKTVKEIVRSIVLFIPKMF